VTSYVIEGNDSARFPDQEAIENICSRFARREPTIIAEKLRLFRKEASLQRHALQVTVEEWKGIPVIQASGEIDLATVPELRAVVNEITARTPRVLIFDFSQVGYMDSSGLGILVSARRRLGVYDGEVVVISAAGSVLKALNLSGLDRILTVVPDRQSFQQKQEGKVIGAVS
jgi:anti-sigma B factor antagonist